MYDVGISPFNKMTKDCSTFIYFFTVVSKYTLHSRTPQRTEQLCLDNSLGSKLCYILFKVEILIQKIKKTKTEWITILI